MYQWYGMSHLEGRIALCMTEMVKERVGKGKLFESSGLDGVICCD